MSKRTSRWCAVAIVGIPLMLTSPGAAQDFFEFWTPSADNKQWTNDDNWSDGAGNLTGAPSIAFESGASMGGGLMIIDADVGTAGIVQSGGTIEIQSGSLTSEATALQSGVTSFNGNLIISGGAKLTGPDITIGGKGSLQLLAANSEVEAKGDFSLGGALHFPIGSGGPPNIKVGGAASINGIISPTFDGVTPAYGDSWPFLSGANSVNIGSKAAVVLPPSVDLPTGLDARLQAEAGTASIAIGNLPVLQVSRVDGATSITNVVGGPLTMTGYNITSATGLLNGAGFTGTGVAGFDKPNPLNTAISEFSLEGTQTLNVGDSISIGNAYGAGATHPNDEDVTFQFSTTDGQIIQGLVEYLGPANDIVLNANPETGEVSLYHLSSHLGPVDITGYLLTSEAGALNAANWTSLADADASWTKANPSANHISELNLESSKEFANGTVFSLGNIFDAAGTRDLRLQYTTATDLFDATITYGVVPDGGGPVGCMPINALLGDLDGNGTVGFPDFLTLSANFGTDVSTYQQGDIDCNGSVGFPDFLTLSANFGQSLPVGAAAAVPEPNSGALLGLGGGLLLALRRRRRKPQAAPARSTSTRERAHMTCWKTMFLSLVAIFVALLTVSQARADLLAYYPFEDGEGTTVTDFSGNDFNGTASDTFAWTDDGFQGGAADFGAFNNGAVVLFPEEFATGDAGFNKIVESQNLTISFWANRQGEDNTNQWTFLFGGSRQLGSHAPWSDGNVYFDVAGCCGANQRIATSLGETSTDGLWHHLAYVKRKDAGAEKSVTAVYLDGNVIVSSPGWDDPNTDPTIDDVVEIDAASIGGDNGGGSSQNGLIDEFAIWNEVLDEADIKALAAGGPVLPLREPLGDFNADGIVDSADFAILAANMGEQFSRDDAVNKGDFNGDLRVNLKDFLGFRQAFNAGSGGAAAAVPEPTAMLLLSLALCGIPMMARGRRVRR